MSGPSLAETAAAYAAAGWPVFALQPNSKVPYKGTRGFKAATTDPDTVANIWRAYPRSNIGTAIPAGLIVVDIDPDHDGLRTLTDLEDRHGEQRTLAVFTGSGGLHLYYRHPGGTIRQGVGILGPGIDTRVPGKGYVVLPPSVHPSGRRYEWVDPTAPSEPMPGWMVAQLRPPPPRVPAPVVTADRGGYFDAALRGELEEVGRAPEGTRNDTLHKAAANLGTLLGAGVGDRSTVEHALQAAATSRGLPPTEATATIKSGLDWGTGHPRQAVNR